MSERFGAAKKFAAASVVGLIDPLLSDAER
jgi:hypothetical protein